MAKLESSLKNMILSLLLISVGMSIALGYVYTLTKKPIEDANSKAEVDAVKAVLPEFNNDPVAEVKEIDGLKLYPAKKDGIIVGCAVKSFTDKAFSGRFDLMVGLLADGSINKIQVVEQKETPGLGTKMKEPQFMNQFLSKNPGSWNMKVKKDGGEVDAISAATISSRAFCDAVQKAYDCFMKEYGGKTTNTTTASTDTTAVISDSTKKGE